MSDLGGYKVIKVRKSCRCAWCGQQIPKGSSATRFHGRWDGAWQDWKMHVECEEFYQRFNDGGGFSLYDNSRPELPLA